MSKSFTFDRFDIDMNGLPEGAYDGEYVLAEDAINREAVLQAQRTRSR